MQAEQAVEWLEPDSDAEKTLSATAPCDCHNRAHQLDPLIATLARAVERQSRPLATALVTGPLT
jgi:hypothetical protein